MQIRCHGTLPGFDINCGWVGDDSEAKPDPEEPTGFEVCPKCGGATRATPGAAAAIARVRAQVGRTSNTTEKKP